MAMVPAAKLRASGIKAAREPSLEIESFEGDWDKEWFTYRPEEWGRRTHKVNDPLWAAPAGANLSLRVRVEQANALVIGIDEYAAEVQVEGGSDWQTILLAPSDFRDAREDGLPSFEGIRELRLLHEVTLRARQPDAARKIGAPWKGLNPAFRELRWVIAPAP